MAKTGDAQRKRGTGSSYGIIVLNAKLRISPAPRDNGCGAREDAPAFLRYSQPI